MELKVYTVRDAKAEAFMQPFFMRTNGEAIRAFIDSVNREDTQFYSHPEDFALFELGTYDEHSGLFENLPQPLSIARAIDHKKQVEMFDPRQEKLPVVGS